MENPLAKMDNAMKIGIIVAVVVGVYFAASLLLDTASPQPAQPGSFDGQLPRGQLPRMRDMMEFYTNSQENGNYALLAAVIAGIVALYFALQGKKVGKETGERAKTGAPNRNPPKQRILLSKDERLIIDRLKEAGELTQDSLRSQLGWSKAKASTVLGGMERRRLIRRAKFGKTHSVILPKNSNFSV